MNFYKDVTPYLSIAIPTIVNVDTKHIRADSIPESYSAGVLTPIVVDCIAQFQAFELSVFLLLLLKGRGWEKHYQ